MGPKWRNLHCQIRIQFRSNQSNYENWRLWPTIWKNECLPKIKFFSWTLLKGKILIAENLRKKCIHGPSMCVLCHEEEESTQHLFLNCVIAKHCWKQIISPLDLNIDSTKQLSPLNNSWAHNYPYAKKDKAAIM